MTQNLFRIMKIISFAKCQWHFCSRAVWYNFIIAVLYWSLWGVTKELFTLTFTTLAWGSEQHGNIHCQHSSAEIPHTVGGGKEADSYSNGLKVFQVAEVQCAPVSGGCFQPYLYTLLLLCRGAGLPRAAMETSAHLKAGFVDLGHISQSPGLHFTLICNF